MTFDILKQMITSNLQYLIKILSETDITKLEIIQFMRIYQEIDHEKNRMCTFEKFFNSTINYLSEKDQEKQAGIYRENIYNCKEKIKELEKEFVYKFNAIKNRNLNKTSLFYRLGEIQEQVKIKMRYQK